MIHVSASTVTRCLVIAALIATSGLAACGRAGPLEPPPAATPSPEAGKRDGTGGPSDEKRTAETDVPNRRFFLDFLLN